MKTSSLMVALAAFVIGGVLGGAVIGARSAPLPSTAVEQRASSGFGRFQLVSTDLGGVVIDTATGIVKPLGGGRRVGTWEKGYADISGPRP